MIDAEWDGFINGDWDTFAGPGGTNWNGPGVPDGTATFPGVGFAFTTDIFFSQEETSIKTIDFLGGLFYTFTIGSQTPLDFKFLTIQGSGLQNATGQTFQVQTTGGMFFTGSSTADQATFNVFGDSSVGPTGGLLSFVDGSNAGKSIININGQGRVDFNNLSTASNATINNASSGTGLFFLDFSHAGNATIHTRPGATTFFDSTSSGDTAHLIIDPGGTLDLTARDTDLTLGSLMGDGTIKLGSGDLKFAPISGVQLFNGRIDGAGGVFLSGPGTTTFGGTNTYTGTTTINQGTLSLGTGGSVAGGVVLQSGTLDLSSHIGDLSIPSLSGGGFVHLGSGDLILNPVAVNPIFSGIIDGPGGVDLMGGTTTFSGANAYTGSTIITGGTLILNPGAALGGGVQVQTGGGLDLSSQTGNLSIRFLSGGGAVHLGGGDLVVDPTDPNVVYVFSGIIDGNGGVVLDGGTTTFSGANTFTGHIVLNGGTLQSSGSAWIDSGDWVVQPSASFDLSTHAGNFGISSLSGAGAVHLGAGDLVIDPKDPNVVHVFSGIIDGNGGVVLNGGTTTFGGANTYTGPTVLMGGTLNLNITGSLFSGVEFNGVPFVPGHLTSGHDSLDLAATAGPTLELSASNQIGGTIVGFAVSDVIDFSFIPYAASNHIVYTPNATNSGGTLSLQLPTGPTITSLNLTGGYTQNEFATADDGHGGTMLTTTAVGTFSGVGINNIYEAVLQRPATQDEITASLATDAASGDGVLVAQIVDSAEAQFNVYPIVQIIKLAVGTDATPHQLAGWVPYVESAGLLDGPAQFNPLLDQMAFAFVASDNFGKVYNNGVNVDPNSPVTAQEMQVIIKAATGIPATQSQIDAWVATGMTIDQVFVGFALGDQYTGASKAAVQQYLTTVAEDAAALPVVGVNASTELHA